MGSCYSYWLEIGSPSHISSPRNGQQNQQVNPQQVPAGRSRNTEDRFVDSGFKSVCSGESEEKGTAGRSSSFLFDSLDNNNIQSEQDISQPLQRRMGEPDGMEMEREFSRKRRDLTIKENQPMCGYPPKKVEKLSVISDGIIYSRHNQDSDSNSQGDSVSETVLEELSNFSNYEFPSLTNSTVATYAKKRLSIEGLPVPGTTDSTFACVLRLRRIVRLTEQNLITKTVLLDNLAYTIQVVEKTYMEETKRLRDEDDDISEAAGTDVPEEVRDWLSSTFTRNLQNGLNPNKPRFRSVANAIRAGIVVERIYRRMSSCACIALPPNVILLLKKGLDEWNFDIFEFNEVSGNHSLKYVGFELLHKYNLISKFQLDTTKLENLLLRLEIGYSKYKNPYHNLLHAADVAQTCHVLITRSRLRDFLSDLDIFAVLYAALIHDFEHTGTTNSFHVQIQTDLALLYNDRNVLESFHVSSVFRITKETEFNIFEKMSKEQYKEFRTSVIDMVLNTDMSLHFSQVKTMKNLITIPEIIDKLKALSMLVHCADISHPCKEWELHRQWSEFLCEEFFRQGDREKELEMTVSPLCDRTTVALPQSQIGFIDFIVEPIFNVLGDMFDKMMENSQEIVSTSANDSDKVSTELEEQIEDDQSGSQLIIPRLWAMHLQSNKVYWGAESTKLEDAKISEKETEMENYEKPENLKNHADSEKNDQVFDGLDDANKSQTDANLSANESEDFQESEIATDDNS